MFTIWIIPMNNQTSTSYCEICLVQVVLTPTLVGGIKPLEIGVKMREYTKMLTILCAEHEQEDCLICDDD